MNNTFERVRKLYVGIGVFALNTVLILVITITLLELTAAWLLKRQATAQDTAVSLTETAYQGMAWKEQFFKDVSAYLAATGGRQVYEPYSLWKNPDFASSTYSVINGYRKTVQPSYASTDSVVTIWMFGGSTMFCTDTPDDWTIPSRLVMQLQSLYPNKKFVISNFGLPGFVRDQQAVLLSRLLMQGKRPNIVIFYDGFNEAHLKIAMKHTMQHGFYELYDQIYRSVKERLWANLVWKSSLLTLVMRSRTDDLKFEKDTTVLTSRAEAVCTDYIQTMAFVQSLAKVYNFTPYFFWQPSLMTTNKSLTKGEARLKTMIVESNGTGYEIWHQTVRRRIFDNPAFAQSMAFDINDALDKVSETAFVDYAHLGPFGNDAVAGRIAQTMSKSGF